MKAHLRKIQISPKKLNVVAGLIRGKSVADALLVLKFTPKKAAKSLYKVLYSAVSNAECNNNLKQENLRVKAVVINKGQVWRRYLPSTRGRALPIRKPTAHISVELEVQ